MRYNEAKEARRLQERYKFLEKLSRLLLRLSVLILCLGWLNFGLVATGHGGTALLALADEPLSILNLLQPLIILFAAFLSCLLARSSTRGFDRRVFLALGVGLVVLAVEEFGRGSHSQWIHRISAMLQTNNPLAIMSPFAIVPLALGASFAPCLLRMPRRYALYFSLSGAIYVLGVLVLETLSQLVSASYGNQSVLYLWVAGVEETLETIGMVGFCTTAISYLSDVSGRLFDG